MSVLRELAPGIKGYEPSEAIVPSQQAGTDLRERCYLHETGGYVWHRVRSPLSPVPPCSLLPATRDVEGLVQALLPVIKAGPELTRSLKKMETGFASLSSMALKARDDGSDV